MDFSGYAISFGPYIRALSQSLSKSATDYDAAMQERGSLVGALDLERQAKNKSTREKELLQKTIDHLRQDQARFAVYAYAPPPIASLYARSSRNQMPRGWSPAQFPVATDLRVNRYKPSVTHAAADRRP